MSRPYPDWYNTINKVIVDHEQRLTMLEQDEMTGQGRAAVHLYGAGTPWPDVAKLQIEELQQSVAVQTATINRLIDDIEHLKLTICRCINRMDGDGR